MCNPNAGKTEVCSRGQRATKALDAMAQGIESLRGLVKEQPGADEKEERRTILQKARDCSSAMYNGRIPHSIECYLDYTDRADLIESLVRKEIEACAKIADEHGLHDCPLAIRARLDR